jgi:serine protease AprX
MNKRIAFYLFIILQAFGVIQAQQVQPYWVFLSDKDGCGFSLSAPDRFLSESALQRRERQQIPLSYSDLPVSQVYVTRLENMGAEIRVQSRWFNAVSIMADEATLSAISAEPFVQSMMPVKSWRRPLQETWNQLPVAKTAVTTETAYGLAGNQNDMIHLEFLHELGYRGQNVTIAVLDGGFEGVDTGMAFAGFWEKEQILGAYNFADGNDSVYFSSLHGTFVLSIMGAERPGSYVGASPDASFYLFRTEVVDSERVAEEDFWLAAAEYADFIGVDIINSSLGYTTFDLPEEDHTYADMDGNTTIVTRAADMAASKGILVCNSAGNSGNDDWQYIGAPADGDSVFSIGAVTPERNYASFSSTGPTADGRIKPNIAVQGDNSAVLHPNGAIYIGSGTSFASPLAAGAAACLWQAFPDKTNMEIMLAMQQSSTQALDPDNLLGYGIPNMAVAYHLLNGTDFDAMEGDIISVFPNIVHDQTTLVIQQPVLNGTSVIIYDFQGRRVMEQAIDYSENPTSLVSLSGLDALPKGSYLLSMVQDETDTTTIIETIRFIRQ